MNEPQTHGSEDDHIASLQWRKAPTCMSAFTLLELMVAMAVLSILLVLLLNIVDSATKFWRNNENRVDSYREARAALQIMSRDFQNLVATTDTNTFRINESAFPIISSIGGAVAKTNGGGAVFLSSLPAKAQQVGINRSDVCQVGYFIALNRSGGSTNESMNLYRYFRSSDPTFQRLQAGSGLFTNPAPQPNTADTELLARNVSAFTISAFTQTNGGFTNFVQSTTTPLPDVLELRITALNQDAARKLDNSIPAWTDQTTPLNRAAVQTFTTRIRLNPPAANH